MFAPTAVQTGSRTQALQQALAHHVRPALLFGCAFLVSWGAGLRHLAGFDVAKLFPLCASALILYWFLFQRPRFGVFPREFTLFVAFVAVHTAITYGVFHPQEFALGYEVIGETADGFTQADSGRGLSVIRFFLFAGFGYAAAALLRSRREILMFSLWYAGGAAIALILGRHSQSDVGGAVLRDTGGFLNANSLGLGALVGIFLCLIVIQSREGQLWQKACGVVLLGGSDLALLRSVSRTSMIATTIGILVMIALGPAHNRVRIAGIVVAVALGAAMFRPAEVTENWQQRFDPSYVRRTASGDKLGTIQDYLRQWPHYLVQGMGYGRAVEATRESYTTRKLWIPHSTYVEILVEFGIVGLSLFLWSLYALWKRIVPSQSGCHRLPADSVVAGFLVAWIMFFISGTYGDRVFWLSWAVIAAYANLRRPYEGLTCRSPGSLRTHDTGTESSS